ncbi:transporter substrate-binding domain-containing protein [Pectinatus haikarae]|uniref:Polar amino acid transport system substrate-binding protein n=1 Tax=Pectinatus haikarae TaxID=349096 RepID=A0ABT9YA51_9FIRM|nr:transporter substrate-binding domain-containing protein [Pectinatus haikarae]MDQ0204711.1 polar amino acid transport system substrate-binding protein [Pectinatus haikarae]
MKWKKIVSALAVTVFSAALLVGCGSSDKAASSDSGSSSASADKVYTIACDAKYAPFSMEIDGKYKGIDVEVLDAIANAEGFKYNLKPMDFSGIIPGLVSGQLDGAIAGITITDERKKAVDFSDAYIDSGSSIVISKNNSDINKLEDITGKTVAVKKGTTGSKFAEDNKDKYKLNITYYDDSPGMMLAVVNGNADFLIEDFPVISYQIKIGEQANLKVAVKDINSTPPQYGFAVKKGENAELLKKFNDGLKKIKDNGTYDKIIGQYL